MTGATQVVLVFFVNEQHYRARVAKPHRALNPRKQRSWTIMSGLMARAQKNRTRHQDQNR
jgi:hypothetical protein